MSSNLTKRWDQESILPNKAIALYLQRLTKPRLKKAWILELSMIQLDHTTLLKLLSGRKSLKTRGPNENTKWNKSRKVNFCTAQTNLFPRSKTIWVKSHNQPKLSDIQMITHRCQSIKIDLLNLAPPPKNQPSHRPPTTLKNHLGA